MYYTKGLVTFSSSYIAVLGGFDDTELSVNDQTVKFSCKYKIKMTLDSGRKTIIFNVDFHFLRVYTH